MLQHMVHHAPVCANWHEQVNSHRHAVCTHKEDPAYDPSASICIQTFEKLSNVELC